MSNRVHVLIQSSLAAVVSNAMKLRTSPISGPYSWSSCITGCDDESEGIVQDWSNDYTSDRTHDTGCREQEQGQSVIERVDLPRSSGERSWVIRWNQNDASTFLAAVDGPDRDRHFAGLVT